MCMKQLELVFERLCQFLSNRDCVRFLSTSTELARPWLQRTRVIVLKDEYVLLFFGVELFQKFILSKIVEPRKQLDMIFLKTDANPDFNLDFSLNNSECTGIHSWRSYPGFFIAMMNNLTAANFEIESIRLSERYLGRIESFHELSRGQKSLILEGVSFPSSVLDFFSPTLEELELNRCSNIAGPISIGSSSEDSSIRLLPQLRKLVLRETNISNLAAFHHVEKLILDRLFFDVVPACLTHIECIVITRCPQLSDVTALQDNRIVTISDCPLLLDVSKCFRNTERISLSGLGTVTDRIHVDLSYYNQCRKFSLKICDRNPLESFLNRSLYHSQLFSQNVVSNTLSRVYLKGVSDPISLAVFCNLKKLEIVESSEDFVLEGLERVSIVILRELWNLSSLAGLGQNQKVIIEDCSSITDFSPLKTVIRVEIHKCYGFRDVSHVDHVQHLTVSDCPYLKDITALGKITYDPMTEKYPIQSLSIRDCPKLRSLEGLAEVIPSLSVKNCRNIRRHEAPQLTIHTGPAQMSGILSLADSLYGIIFQYLSNEEVVQFLSTTPYLYDTLIKKYRMIRITGNTCHDFLLDSRMVLEVFSKIEKPYEQLQLVTVDQIMDWEMNLDDLEEIPVDLPVLGFQRLQTNTQFFVFLCGLKEEKQQQSEEWFVKELLLLHDREEQELFFEYTVVLPYLHKARESIVLKDMEFPPNSLQADQFAPTLQELTIFNCVGLEDDDMDDGDDDDDMRPELPIELPILPQLQILQVRNSHISNLHNFNYLQELVLDSLSYVQSVTAFSSIPRLTLALLPNLSDVSVLRDNQMVCIFRCPKVNNFTACFPKVKKLILDEEEGCQLDLSHYPELQEFTLQSKEYSQRTNGVRKLCSKVQIPLSLKSVSLTSLKYFHQTHIFHSVHTLTLYNCSSVVSVKGLGSVRVLTLTYLLELASLDGLTKSHTKSKKKVDRRNRIVTVSVCPKIKDFSPLRNVPKVTIENCSGLTNGYELDGVEDLTIRSCFDITDISMLVNAKRLSVIYCPRVKEVSSIAEIVPNFTYKA